MKKNFKTRLATLSSALAGLVTAGSASAAAPTTVSELATSVDFSTVGAGILAVAGTVISLYVLWKGAKFVIGAVKGA